MKIDMIYTSVIISFYGIHILIAYFKIADSPTFNELIITINGK